jgi:hypothetical protein
MQRIYPGRGAIFELICRYSVGQWPVCERMALLNCEKSQKPQDRADHLASDVEEKSLISFS